MTYQENITKAWQYADLARASSVPIVFNIMAIGFYQIADDLRPNRKNRVALLSAMRLSYLLLEQFQDFHHPSLNLSGRARDTYHDAHRMFHQLHDDADFGELQKGELQKAQAIVSILHIERDFRKRYGPSRIPLDISVLLADARQIFENQNFDQNLNSLETLLSGAS
ncbi:hypothetical protein COV20_00485 [Candidatus Woesearchaeota archaeon CG10_big_fil_rev_8_21_14_0_10_45_16]|nr:MAG: hypothetical protein COV20_00485 [Candidatus Woesearchaeota archaeon CG10_big_fil_rev_8_21_14_0_10_45_16]